MLLSSILFVINLITYNPDILIGIFIISLVYNVFLETSILDRIKKGKHIFFFLIMTFLMQVYFNQEGKILFSIYDKVFLTENGVKKGLTLVLKILNIFITSGNINFRKIFRGKFDRYIKIIEITIELVPEVFVLFKNRLNPKETFLNLYKKVYKKL